MPTADELLGPEVAAALVGVVARAAPTTSLAALAVAAGSLGPLALRERTDLLAAALLADLGDGYPRLEEVVLAALTDPAFTGWMVWPVTEALVTAALADGSPEAFDAALDRLADLTPRLTAEFAIRRLLAADLHRALAAATRWTAHPDEHVRRPASEGTRPFLPWSTRVPAILAEPEATVAILDALHRDPSAYVRRSVANHLNDLNRQQPELAVTAAARWLGDADEHTAGLVRHGLRTLVKQGHPAALALLGFPPAPDVAVGVPVLGRTKVVLGGELPFEVTLVNHGTEPARLAIDYVVHHVKANGSRTPKVFKLATRVLAAGERVTLARRHSFKPISTRRYHPGEHALGLQVNGVATDVVAFDLSTG